MPGPDGVELFYRLVGAGADPIVFLRGRPGLVNSPALVVEGAESIVRLDDVRAWAKAVSNGRLLLVPGAGHMNSLDQPDLVIAAFDEFFRGT